MKKQEAVILVNAFYAAFQKKQIDKMIQLYHKDLTFNDPAFGDLNFEETCSMWKMLDKSSDDLAIEFDIFNHTC